MGRNLYAREWCVGRGRTASRLYRRCQSANEAGFRRVVTDGSSRGPNVRVAITRARRRLEKKNFIFKSVNRTVLRGARSSAVVPPRACVRYAQTIRKTFEISFRSKCARTVARERVYFARKQIRLGIVSVPLSLPLARHGRAGETRDFRSMPSHRARIVPDASERYFPNAFTTRSCRDRLKFSF